MDKLTIINKALMKCGLPLAAALDDCDWNASLIFDSARDECLRTFSWNFAMRYVVLGQGAKPAHGFNRGYTLPDDFVRVIDVHNCQDLRSPKARYNVSGNRLYTQASPCNLRYVTNDIDPEDWPADFADVVACRIAAEIAPLSTQTMNMAEPLYQKYLVALAAAQATDARENNERVPHDYNIMLARAGIQGAGEAPRG